LNKAEALFFQAGYNPLAGWVEIVSRMRISRTQVVSLIHPMRLEMILKFLKKSWFHILILAAMFFYLVCAPQLVALVSTNGKPLHTDGSIPAESDQISFVVEGVEASAKEQNLWNLYGWAFLIPQKDIDPDLFVREIILVSDEQKYFFSAESVSRNPSMPSYFTDRGVEFDTLGFNALILQATIKPGKYRIGIVFRNASAGMAYYSDKPAYFLIKTPNTMRVEGK
jgi:hypothetical protein